MKKKEEEKNFSISCPECGYRVDVAKEVMNKIIEELKNEGNIIL